MRKITLLICVLALSVPAVRAYAAEEAIRQEQAELGIQKEKELRQRIESPREGVSEVEGETKPVPAVPLAGEEKAFVKTIKVTGAVLIPEARVWSIVLPFEDRELTLTEMQKVADLVTDAYRQRGYVTSTAVLPPQKIRDNVLEIRVIEGMVGEVDVREARYFRQSFIRKAIRMDKGQPFNANRLRYYLSKLNEHPDRNIKAVLAPGKEQGSTDIILQVKDRLPLHARIDYDNLGSRYLRKNRYSLTLTDNNLFGFDDIFSVQYQVSDASDYRLLSGRYLIPVNDRVKMGFFAAKSGLSLGKEFREVMARGKSETYSIYTIFDLVRRNDLTVSLNTGFDYKDAVNLQMTDVESKDRMRVARAGLDVDYSDSLMGGGRSILSPEVDFGIPGMFGGSEAKDDDASRVGAGGKFVKYGLSFLRLQNLPKEATLLWKNSAQVSPYVLTATEQFQLGGIANVRGFPSADKVGDEGYTTTFELTVPPYGLNRSLRVPFTNDKIYDTFRLAAFYDWGYARLHRPQAGEQEDNTLSAAGCGLRVNLTNDFTLRLDLAWPLTTTPVDNKHLHPWLQVAKEF